MNYTISLITAIVLTSLAYFFGALFITNGLLIWEAFFIGFSVVILGALTEVFRAPIWLIVFVPFPVGMFLLYILLNMSVLIWFMTYLMILVLYTVIHIIASYFFQFHSLIPAWKLS